MNEAQKTILTQRISEILYYIWDPIGVNGFVETRAEYDSYVPEVRNLLLDHASEKDIARHLYDIEIAQMEVRGSLEGCRSVAVLLRDLVDFVNRP